MPDEVPRLSPSIASTLINRSPLHAWQQHRLLGGVSKETTPAMEKGKIIEILIFRHELDKLVTVGADNWMTKDAKTAREMIRSSGKIAVLEKDMTNYNVMAHRVCNQLREMGIVFNGENQTRLEWTNNGTNCSGYTDHIVWTYLDHGPQAKTDAVIYDLKTTDNASTAKIQRKMVDMGYDIQGVAYVEAVEAKYKEIAGRVKMVFIFAEVEPPYAINVVEMAGSMKALGQSKWDRAKQIWKNCLDLNMWPSYSTEITRIEAMPWQINTEIETTINDEVSE